MINAFLFQAIANFCSLFLGLILPNWLGESSLAEYLLANTVLQTAMLVALLGTKQTLERSYGPWFRKGEGGALLSSMTMARLGATAAAAGVAVLLSASFRSSGLSASLVPILVALVLFRSLGEFPFHLRLSLGEKTAGAWPQSVRFLLRIPAVLGGFLWNGVTGAMVLCLAAEMLLAGIGWWRARADFRWSWMGISPEGMAKEWKFTTDIAVYSLLVIALNGLGPWTAGWLGGSASRIIDFTMAWSLALQFLQLNYVAQQAAVPVLVKALENGDRAAFHDGVDTQVRWTWILVSLTTGMAVLLAKPAVLWAYGLTRLGLIRPLVLCFAAVSAWAMLSVYLHGLFATGRARPTAYLHGAMLAVAALLFATFAPRFGTRVLPTLYLVICAGGWAAALWIYRRETRCPLTLPTAKRIALSAGYGLVALGASRYLPATAAAIVFLLVHGSGIVVSGLLSNARGPALSTAPANA